MGGEVVCNGLGAKNGRLDQRGVDLRRSRGERDAEDRAGQRGVGVGRKALAALQDGGISLPATAAPGVYAVQVGNYGSTLIRK